MHLGGPVWHASARSRNPIAAVSLASRILEGVGSKAFGEWVELGNRGVVHIRRRLTHDEAKMVNELRDIRGTTEERERLCALLADAPHLAPALNLRPPAPHQDPR